MTPLRSIWNFVAGDSRYAPLGIVIAVLGAVTFVNADLGPAITQTLYVLLVAATLVVAVFEPQ